MGNSFTTLIDSANSILILLPQKPYFDQVAAGLSLYLTLRDRKETIVYCPSPMLVQFNRLIGVNKITQEMGNKNLTIKFLDYQANDIERVSYDIENGEFKLTVVPKPGFQSPKKEQIDMNYSGIAADMVILIGGADESHFPALSSKELTGTKLLHVGTRELTTDRELISFSRSGSSVSEVVYTLIKESGWEIDPDTSTNLLMGIESGSREFTGPEVTAETFETVANLMKSGGKRLPRERSAKAIESPVFPMEVKREKPEKEKPPKDWLEPKIYKGTSVS